MKNTTLIFVIVVILVLAGSFIFVKTGNASELNRVPNSGSGNSGNGQNVVIGMKNYNYYPNTVKVKAGEPISLSLDSSVGGCFRDFTIRELGIRKYLQTPKDSLEFTIPEKGTYTFACSMGMGVGKIIAE